MIRNLFPRRYFPLLFLALAASLLSACGPARPTPAVPLPPRPTPAVPRLRIDNHSAHDLKNLTVLFPGQRISFGDVPAGSTSEYRDAPGGVYRYAAYEAEVNGASVMQAVVDWMGEEPLPGAQYTYHLDADPNGYARNQVIVLLGVEKDP